MSEKKNDKRGAPKGSFGNKPYEPSEQSRKQVETMAGLGVSNQDIATILDIDETTLYKYYKRELDTSAIAANARVAQAAYHKAMSGDPQMLKYWLNCRARWSEKEDDKGGGQTISIVTKTFLLPDKDGSPAVEIEVKQNDGENDD